VTVAESRASTPLTGGLDLVPDHTFADVGDVAWIVVPEVQEADSPRGCSRPWTGCGNATPTVPGSWVSSATPWPVPLWPGCRRLWNWLRHLVS
jgi:hypothetical protein